MIIRLTDDDTYVGTGDQTRGYMASPHNCFHRTCCILCHHTVTHTHTYILCMASQCQSVTRAVTAPQNHTDEF